NNVVSIADAVTPGNSQGFGYDLLDRLTSTTGSAGSVGYTYDPVGNRLTRTFSGVTATYAYTPASNRLASISMQGVTQTIAYTATGNIASITSNTETPTTLGYNAAGRLTVVRTPKQAVGNSYRYAYDAFGQRLVKSLASAPQGTPVLQPLTLYQYDRRGHLLEEQPWQGAPTDYLYLEDRPIAILFKGTLSFLHTDRLGTPQRATDSLQAIVWDATYAPFGHADVTGSITQKPRLPRPYFDQETGWHQNGFRDYVPSWGRYLESDPIGLAGGINPYAYAAGNPVSMIDPSGTSAVLDWLLGKAVNKTQESLTPKVHSSLFQMACGMSNRDAGDIWLERP